MADYLIAFDGNAPDPAGTGDTKSWFFYYKWRPDEEDEVFVPVGVDEFECAVAGDHLWFSMDGELVGGTILIRTTFDPFNGRKEMWFCTQHCIRTAPVKVDPDVKSGPISKELALQFTGQILVENPAP